MSRSTAIELHGVGKRFTKYVDTPMLLTSALRFRPQTRRERFWALRGLDLTVADGEFFGVIGRNGSGKSTLMTMVAGITAPTEGSVRVWGRVAPLIQVGVGFHRELTGRENIYVNGAILGLTKRQIDDRLEEIIDFSEVEDFIDTPVKFYSSGMFVRLGFAVAVHAEPDVLIIDEVLAVGDLGFQVKCYERMNQIRDRGSTVIMVSHHLGLVSKLCERVLLIHKGTPRHLGPAEDSIAAFHDILSAESETFIDAASGLRHEPQVVEIESVELLGPDGIPTGHLDAGQPATLRVRARALQAVDDLVVASTLFAQDGTALYADSTAGHPFGAVEAGRDFSWTMAFRSQLPTGSYQIAVRIDRPDLRTTLLHHPPLSFFVTGRNTVSGLADLEAVFTRRDEDLCFPEAISRACEPAGDVVL
jgi:ABC-type polysaccharide/polyol phosphate transport system ATPase subunit